MTPRKPQPKTTPLDSFQAALGPINDLLKQAGITSLLPVQKKAIESGLMEGKSLLVCSPTASGKTLIAELSFLRAILLRKEKAVYIVPLKALATEKFKDFKRKYKGLFKIALAIGDPDSPDTHLKDFELVICTAEKLDALLRHRAPWISSVGCVITDEVHLLNDASRGPTLEILLTMLRKLLPKAQFVSLSATIGNPEELASWLKAGLVRDNWRPVPLHKGIYWDSKIEFV